MPCGPARRDDGIAALSAIIAATVEQYQWPKVLEKYEAVLGGAALNGQCTMTIKIEY